MEEAQVIVGEASTTVRASPREVFDFVIDLERYRQADRKIGRVGEIRRFERDTAAEMVRFKALVDA
jgi:Flp pilus assembly CpaF family ATPase